MSDPVDRFLTDAVSAAREQAADGVDDGAHTRLRLRESLASGGAQRRKRFTLIAAVIASLFGSTAFAYWAGWRPPWSKPAAVAQAPDDDATQAVSMRLPEARGSAIAAIPDAGAIAAETLAPSAEIVAPAPALPVAPTAPPPSTLATPPAPRAPKTVPRPAHVTRTPDIVVEAPAPVGAPPVETPPSSQVDAPPPPPRVTAAAPQPSAELAAYRNAHALHFRGNDPAAALAAWDAYLAAYPSGALAPEARYDRALVLVKLGRWVDARAALAPFANAAAGAYRQKEAAAILAAIRDR